MKIAKTVKDNGNALKLEMGRLTVKISNGLVRVYKSEQDGKPQLVKASKYKQDKGLQRGESWARQYLDLRIKAEQEYETRQLNNAEAVKEENLLTNPAAMVAASRSGAKAPVLDPTEPQETSFDDMMKNPAFAVTQARNQERD